MLGYYTKLALHNIRRAPLLYALVILTIAIGVGALLANLALIRTMTADPIPQKSDKLFHISMNTGFVNNPDDPPRATSRYTDMKAIEDSGIATSFVMTYYTGEYVRVVGDKAPGRVLADIRPVSLSFFEMMDTPFHQGEGFSSRHAKEIIVSQRFKEELFASEEAMGKQIDIKGMPFTIVGVLKNWNMRPKFYQAGYGIDFDGDADIFVPFETALDADMRPRLQTSSSENYDDMADSRAKPVFYMHGWAKLDTPEQKAKLQQFMDGYATKLKEAGEHEGPVKNHLHDVSEWIEYMEVVDSKVVAFAIATGLFLLVCLFNASSLLLSRYESMVFETGLQRALGASKKQLFSQGLVESLVVGAVSAFFALLLSWVFLKVSTRFLPNLEELANLDSGILGLGAAIALATTVLCCVYPLWRTSQRSISLELKG